MARRNDDKASGDFMLAEYDNHREQFLRNEEMGDRRVNFFLTVATAIIGALAIGDREMSLAGIADTLTFVALGALLIFGWLTLSKIVSRNLETSRQLRALGRVRRYFIDRDPELEAYIYFPAYDDAPIRKSKQKPPFFLGKGGLAETVSLVNSLLVAGLAGLGSASFFDTPGLAWLLAVVGFLAGQAAQFLWVRKRYRDEEPKPEDIRFPNPG